MSASSLVVVGNAWRLTTIIRKQERKAPAGTPTHPDEGDDGVLRPDSGSLDASLRMPRLATVH
jgi:hypothetical protein